MTDFLANEIAAEQWEDGGWHESGGLARAPLEDGDFSRTAMAIKVLKTYGTPKAAPLKWKVRESIAPQIWLLQAKPEIAEDYDMAAVPVRVVAECMAAVS